MSNDHRLKELGPSGEGARKVRYYVVEDITVTSTPTVSGVLDDQAAAQTTPEWLRKLIQTGEVDLP